MTICAPVRPYTTSSWHDSYTQDSARPQHRIPHLGDAANERLVARKLGVNGFKRWQYFRQHFSGRWGDEGQLPVSPRSQESFIKALQILEFAPEAKPSLFLTDDGHFELVWKDAEGHSVQVEFGPNSFEIYLEGAGLEETYSNGALVEVLTRYI